MFKKILQNLPYNPSLISQMTFYTGRLRQEASVRRIGLVFMVLTMLVQVYAVVSPPQPTLAASTNDIIYGGIGTNDPVSRLLAVYDADTDGRNSDIRALFESFNISRADIAASTKGSINSRDGSLYSLGRNPHSVLDQPRIVGSKRYYLRPLSTWGNNKSFAALTGTRTNIQGTQEDKFFAIILDCGNIVVKLRSQPELHTTKAGLSGNNGATVQRGQTVGYRIFFSNLGAGTAHNVTITDALPAHTSHVWHSPTSATSHNYHVVPKSPFAGQPSSRHIEWVFSSMPARTENWYVDLSLKIDDDAPTGSQICNEGYLRSLEAPPKATNKICYTVKSTATPVTNYKPPTQTIGQPAITLNKKASNLTQDIQNAHESHANPGDTITYQLLTTNDGTATYDEYSVREEINDILEYADVTEISDGGKLDNGAITWKSSDIKPSSTLTRSFKIQVKDPLPATPRSSSDPESYDLRMDNVYGDEIKIHLTPPTIGKTAEQVATTLPSTGPGSSIAIGFAVTVIIGYFFARNRLMVRELETVRNEFATSGGF